MGAEQASLGNQDEYIEEIALEMPQNENSYGHRGDFVEETDEKRAGNHDGEGSRGVSSAADEDGQGQDGRTNEGNNVHSANGGDGPEDYVEENPEHDYDYTENRGDYDG